MPLPWSLLVHAAFILSGVLTTFLGPALPTLQARFALDDAQSGSLFGAQFAGATLATSAAGALMARFGGGAAIACGLTLVAAALGALQLGTLAVARPALFLLGAGLGFATPTVNLWAAAQVSGREKVAVLNSINLAWGLGAALCPLVVRASQAAAGGFSLFLIVFATASLGLAAAALAVLPKGRMVEPQSSGTRASVLAVVVPFALFLFLYVGVETSVGGWAATYAKRDWGGAWFLAPVVFWIGMLGGRGMAARWGRRFEERRILRSGALLAAAGIAAWAALPAAWTLPLVLVIGLGLAPLYPTGVAVFAERLGAAGMAAAGPVFALSGLGGAAIPWLVGIASAHFGALQAGLCVVLAAALAVLALTWAAFNVAGAAKR